MTPEINDEAELSGDPRVGFILIGAMKAATSTVSAYLENNPQVYMLPRQEPNFFSYDENFGRGVATYEDLFREALPVQLRGEGSNSYSARNLYPQTAPRMAAYNPDMKIIYMVRHPLDRIVSAWIQNRADSGDAVPPTLDRAILEMPERYVGESLYWHNISGFRACFGDSQIFVGFMEDMKSDPASFFGKLCDFLGIVPIERATPLHMNKSRDKRIPGRSYTLLNKMPYFATLKNAVPKGARTAIKSGFLSRSVAQRPEISRTTRRQILEVLKPDTQLFLRHYGKPPDFWLME